MIVLCGLVFATVQGCGGGKLNGKYVAEASETLWGEPPYYEFRRDGTYYESQLGTEGTYEVKGNELTLRTLVLGTTVAMKLTIEGDTIIGSDGFFGKAVYKKQR